MRPDTGAGFGARAIGTCAMLALLLAAGCSRGPAPKPQRPVVTVPLAVQVYADTGRGGRLEVRPPTTRVWLASVTPTRALPPVPVPPAGPPDSLPPPGEAPPGLEVDPGLKPPVLRVPAVLALPPGWNGPRTSVELDVRVDETGRVSDAQPARAAGDPAAPDVRLLEAARRCALGMRFYPALQAGRPVPVWCRQRFDFGGAQR